MKSIVNTKETNPKKILKIIIFYLPMHLPTHGQ